MAGRAGRVHGVGGAAVDIVVAESEVDDFRSEYDAGTVEPVASSLSRSSELTFHLLPEIPRAPGTSVSSLRQWYARSFASAQGLRGDVESALQALEELEAVQRSGDRVCTTELGTLSSELYFRPEVMVAWRVNFGTIFGRGIENSDIAVAWALSDVPEPGIPLATSAQRLAAGDYRDQIEGHGLFADHPSLGRGLVWWGALGGPRIKGLKHIGADLKRDFGRVKMALLGLDRLSGWEMEGFFEDLAVQVAYGVSGGLVELCKLPGVGKTQARCLYNLGVRSKRDLPGAMALIAEQEWPELLDTARKIVDDLPRESDSGVCGVHVRGTFGVPTREQHSSLSQG